MIGPADGAGTRKCPRRHIQMPRFPDSRACATRSARSPFGKPQAKRRWNRDMSPTLQFSTLDARSIYSSWAAGATCAPKKKPLPPDGDRGWVGTLLQGGDGAFFRPGDLANQGPFDLPFGLLSPSRLIYW